MFLLREVFSRHVFFKENQRVSHVFKIKWSMKNILGKDESQNRNIIVEKSIHF